MTEDYTIGPSLTQFPPEHRCIISEVVDAQSQRLLIQRKIEPC